jgi:ribosomal-protein-alanine N-acetyltransferase
MTQAAALQFLEAQSQLDADADNCWIMFAIERLEDKRMIGEVGLYIVAASRGAGDMGWSLQRDFQGRGYAAEAARWLVAHAFGERRLQSLSASMSAHNSASARLCERLGMRLDATIAKAQRVGDDWHDVRRYVLVEGAS